MTVFTQGLELISNVHAENGAIKTQDFLDICRGVLPIVEKLGTGFAIVKSDVGGNIDRLATRAATQPDLYNPDFFQMVRDDVAAGEHTGSSSVTKGMLWLKRAMQFVVALLDKMHEDHAITLSEAASQTYYSTLQQYHGWIVTGTFTVALKLVPSRETFFEKIGATTVNDPALMADMKSFCDGFTGVLNEVHSFLDQNGLDDPYKV